MKRYLLVFILFVTTGCNSFLPYKGQSLDDLHQVIKNPEQYQGNIVSFAGEIRGVTEDIHQVKFVLKVEAPFYYYATGKDPLSYQLLLIDFQKEKPQLTGLKINTDIKVLARINKVETRSNVFGTPIAVLHLQAVAVSARSLKKDFFHTTQPDHQLYLSWKAGRLFFTEPPAEILSHYLPVQTSVSHPGKAQTPEPISTPVMSTAPEPDLVFEEEETFILPEE